MKILLNFLCLILSFTTFAHDNKLQCIGKTIKGESCSRSVKEGELYCFQHNSKSLHCGATTKSGGNCKRVVKVSGYCSQHSK